MTIADAADAITMVKFTANDLAVETKPDMTPVTEADRAVEELARQMLAEARPDDAVLGEEFGHAGQSARTWIIDPIDGTKNFVRGVPVWATLIALVENSDVVVGVVSAPALSRRWWARHGGGAWTTNPVSPNPTRLHVSGVTSLDDASFSYSDPIGWSDRGTTVDAIASSVWRSRAYGDFWSHVLVAEGTVDIAAEPDLGPWDIAALVPVVTEAGGQITAFDGSPALTGGSAVTTNKHLHAAVLAKINPNHP